MAPGNPGPPLAVGASLPPSLTTVLDICTSEIAAEKSIGPEKTIFSFVGNQTLEEKEDALAVRSWTLSHSF